MIPIFAAIAVAVGVSAATPAAADTRLSIPANTVTTPLATPGVPTATADQYRNRSRYRHRAGWRQYRYRPRYYANRGWHRGWRRGGLACRTAWRYGRPHRVCWRR
jgi:hypothetical protein